MSNQPTNTTQLAAVIRQDAPESILKYVTEEQLNRIAGLVAHHGARVEASGEFNGSGTNTAQERRRQRRALRKRVKADTVGVGIGSVVLMAVISWCVQRFLDWCWTNRDRVQACAAIGQQLPPWNDEDRAAVAAVGTDDDDGD